MTTDHEDRLRAMLDPDQETWDLSPNDTRAIRWALDELESLRARVAELEARLAARPAPATLAAADPSPAPPPPPLFARELATYERLRPVLLTYAEGQYAVILGDTCHAVERTYEAALRVAYTALGLKPFMVKQILAVEPVLHMVPH